MWLPNSHAFKEIHSDYPYVNCQNGGWLLKGVLGESLGGAARQELLPSHAVVSPATTTPSINAFACSCYLRISKCVLFNWSTANLLINLRVAHGKWMW
jgi:hypothetical protein